MPGWYSGFFCFTIFTLVSLRVVIFTATRLEEI